MKNRFRPPRFAAPEPKPKPEEEKDKEGNALWRMDEWFPFLAPNVKEKVKAYHAELLKFNVRLNLVSRTTEREADEIHFADCLLASEIILKKDLGKQVYDIGSGNGMPGILLGIVDPKRQYFLVESDNRKCEFLKHVVHDLALENVTIMNARFENLVGTGIKVAISRGFASISKTLLICNKIFQPGGQFYHLKGSNWSSEIAELPSQIISVWSPELVGEYSLPATQAARAVIITQKKS